MGRLLRGLAAAQMWAAAIGLLAITLLIVISVLARYVFHAPLAWSEEGSRLTLIVVVYLGTGAVSYHGDLLRADVFGESLSPRVRRLREILVEVLMAALFTLLAVQAMQFALRIREVGQITAALAIPQWLIIAMASVGLGLIVLTHLYRIVALLRGTELPRSAFASAGADPEPLR